MTLLRHRQRPTASYGTDAPAIPAAPDTPAAPDAPAPLLRVWVPGNPISSNHMYGNRRQASGPQKRSRRLTPEAEQWRNDVAASTMAWRFAEEAPRPLLSVSCVFVGTHADLDNLLKLTLDGLKLGLMVDDRYIQRLAAEKRPPAVRGERGVWIEVTQLPTPATAAKTKRPRRPAVRRTA